MKINRTIQLKATFLLAIFTINMLVGFACAIGLNMGFNAAHAHADESVSAVTVSHHHETTKPKTATEDNNCCTDELLKFSQLDKLLELTINAGTETPVTWVYLYYADQPYLSPYTPNLEGLQVARPFITNARGIRVSIQSFQI